METRTPFSRNFGGNGMPSGITSEAPDKMATLGRHFILTTAHRNYIVAEETAGVRHGGKPR